MRTRSRLVAWRKRKGLTQDAAAAAIGASQAAWAGWEIGSRVPDRESAVAIERLTEGEISVSAWPQKAARARRRAKAA